MSWSEFASPHWLLILLFAPLLASFCWLGLAMLLSARPAEARCATVVNASLLLALLADAGLILHGWLQGKTLLSFGPWFSVGDYHYELVAAIDAIAVSYAFYSLLFLTLIGSFSRRYLHREPGFHRFYLMLLLFALGLLTVAFAGTLELLLVGWELVGLCSLMLISFFTQRPKPPRNALWAFTIYRCTDIGLYAAILLLHAAGSGSLLQAGTEDRWFGIAATAQPALVGALVFVAVMGKAALFPFSGWLPRAMEGPTPSSAVFYGALSVSLGPLLLLRSHELLAAAPALAAAVTGIGLLTAVLGNFIGRVQTDIKSRLAFGSVTQLGFITAEIGLGWNSLALLHLLAHGVLRSLQILRAPSLIHERQQLEQLLGHRLGHGRPSGQAAGPLRRWLYRFALERGFLDLLLQRWLVELPLSLVRRLDRLDAAIADRIGGKAAAAREEN
jgi:NADH-quinone oxidoreductase subunit L